MHMQQAMCSTRSMPASKGCGKHAPAPCCLPPRHSSRGSRRHAAHRSRAARGSWPGPTATNDARMSSPAGTQHTGTRPTCVCHSAASSTGRSPATHLAVYQPQGGGSAHAYASPAPARVHTRAPSPAPAPKGQPPEHLHLKLTPTTHSLQAAVHPRQYTRGGTCHQGPEGPRHCSAASAGTAAGCLAWTGGGCSHWQRRPLPPLAENSHTARSTRNHLQTQPRADDPTTLWHDTQARASRGLRPAPHPLEPPPVPYQPTDDAVCSPAQ
jgi:hypothetical protein